MTQFSLRTLIVMMLISPPLVVGAWREIQAYRASEALRLHLKRANPRSANYPRGFTPKYDFPTDVFTRREDKWDRNVDEGISVAVQLRKLLEKSKK
jgi:hypothetical protein